MEGVGQRKKAQVRRGRCALEKGSNTVRLIEHVETEQRGDKNIKTTGKAAWRGE